MFKALNLSNVPFLVLVDLCDIYFFLEAYVYTNSEVPGIFTVILN